MMEQENGHMEMVSDDPYAGLLTIKEAAQVVGLTPEGINWNIRKGNLERVRIDGINRIRKEDLDTFNARRISGTAHSVLSDAPPPHPHQQSRSRSAHHHLSP